MRKLFLFFAFALHCFVSAAQEKPDTAIIAKIRAEGLTHSGVMDIAFHLTDASGPRLMNSPGFFRAANWAKNTLKEWGLDNAALEPWGTFGKGWELQKSYIAMTAPYYKPLIGLPKTWTSGTNGLQTAEVVIVTAKDSVELMTYTGKLKGKIIILPPSDTLKPGYCRCQPVCRFAARKDGDLSTRHNTQADYPGRFAATSRGTIGPH